MWDFWVIAALWAPGLSIDNTTDLFFVTSFQELEFAALIVAEAGIDNGDYDDLTNDAAQLNGDCDFDRDGQPIAKKSRLATASKSRPAPTAAFFDEDLTNFYEQPTDIFCEVACPPQEVPLYVTFRMYNNY